MLSHFLFKAELIHASELLPGLLSCALQVETLLFVIFMDLLNLIMYNINCKFRAKLEGLKNHTGRCSWNVNWRSRSTVMSFVLFLP